VTPRGNLLFSTYLGTADHDTSASDLALDARAGMYIVGTTDGGLDSANAPQMNYGGGRSDAFLTVLNSSGSRALYTSYLGGNDEDKAEAVVIGASGIVALTLLTLSADFPGHP